VYRSADRGPTAAEEAVAAPIDVSHEAIGITRPMGARSAAAAAAVTEPSEVTPCDSASSADSVREGAARRLVPKDIAIS
jgi:hypothetical protein